MYNFALCLVVMAGVTYLVRMLPLVIFKNKIKNRFILSFLHYMPYAVLTVMTVPACVFATGNMLSAVIGVAAALIVAYINGSLLGACAFACAGAFITELIIRM